MRGVGRSRSSTRSSNKNRVVHHVEVCKTIQVCSTYIIFLVFVACRHDALVRVRRTSLTQSDRLCGSLGRGVHGLRRCLSCRLSCAKLPRLARACFTALSALRHACRPSSPAPNPSPDAFPHPSPNSHARTHAHSLTHSQPAHICLRTLCRHR